MLARLKQHWYRRKRENTPISSYFSAPLPDKHQDFRQLVFLAADLELTSLAPQSGEIVCIAFVPIVRGKVVMAEAERWMIKTQQSVGDSAAIHGIHDHELETAVPLEQAMERFLQCLSGRVLLLHHAPLDMKFLNSACKQLYGVPLIARVVDTLKLEMHRTRTRGQHPKPGALRLYQCRERYNLPLYKAHDALSDAVATAELFLAQAEHMAGDQPLPLRTLLKKSN